jgi:outer membrane protein OmpA-like peptidoglycan-associated protein
VIDVAPATPIDSADDVVDGDSTNGFFSTTTLNWTDPANAYSAPTTGWTLRYRETGASTWTIFPGMMIDPTVDVEGLLPDTEYEFQIAGINAAGVGEYGDSFTFTTSSPTLTTANAPAFDSSSATLNTILVSWLETDNDGGQAVTGYSLGYRESGASSWTFVQVGTVLNRLITGLKSDTDYEFEIAAINGSGTGDYSEVSTVRTGKPERTTTTPPVVKTVVAVAPEANADPVVATVTVPSNSGANNNSTVQVITAPTSVSLVDAGTASAVSLSAPVNAVVQLTSSLFGSQDVVQVYLQTPDGTWIDLGQGAVNSDGTLALPALKLKTAGVYNIVMTLAGRVSPAGVSPRYGSLTQSAAIKVGTLKPAATTVLFDLNSASLSKKVQGAIKAWIKRIGKTRVVYVDGYANGITYKGAKADKLVKKIAAARANAVAKFLKSLGVTVKAAAHGALKPVSKKAVAKNRRVVLSVK